MSHRLPRAGYTQDQREQFQRSFAQALSKRSDYRLDKSSLSAQEYARALCKQYELLSVAKRRGIWKEIDQTMEGKHRAQKYYAHIFRQSLY